MLDRQHVRDQVRIFGGEPRVRHGQAKRTRLRELTSWVVQGEQVRRQGVVVVVVYVVSVVVSVVSVVPMNLYAVMKFCNLLQGYFINVVF